jgi:hypothetical protein
MSYAIGSLRVSDFVETLFAEDLHAKRVLSLANATAGVLRAGTLGIHAIGRGLAAARRTSNKHSVKQVDRLIGNEAVSPWELFSSWVPYVVADRSEIWVALDWTDFDADNHTTLVASLVSSHGRTTPLLRKSWDQTLLKGFRIDAEEELLQRLREVLPATVSRTVVIADRGFGDNMRWTALRRLGFDFVIRVRADVHVTNEDGEDRLAGDWVQPSGRLLTLKNAMLTEAMIPVATFVAVKDPRMKDSWCLVSSLSDMPGRQLVTTYGRRFTIEESFRDIKDLRFGMGLSSMRVSTTSRRDRLLLVSAMAIALLTLLGAAGEAAGIDRHFKVNTSKKRQYSLFRQGCDYYEFLPGMRDDWALPLITNFVELLSAHLIFRQTLGPI